MAEKADPKQRSTFEELLRAGLYGQEATRRVPVRKGLLFNGEVLAKIEAVPWELEGKREGQDSQPDEQPARQRFDRMLPIMVQESSQAFAKENL